MKIKEVLRPLISGFCLIIITNPVLAKTSAEYAAMGKASWSAFECSVYAEKSNNRKEQERLFIYAYEQGKQFIEAIKLKKIKSEDISKGVPFYMPMLLSGPSTDFMLGRVFEFVVDLTYEKFSKTNDKETASMAKNLFWEQNCQLIGK